MNAFKNMNVDWTKALSFLLAFVFCSVLIVTTFLVPTIRDYKKQSVIYDIENSSYRKVKEKFEAASSELKKFKEENSRLISDLQHELNEQNLKKTALKKFKTFEIEQEEQSSISDKEKKEGFAFKDYKCTASMTQPSAMFEFFEELKTLGNVVKLRTPLVLAASGDDILLGFSVRVYTIDKTKYAIDGKPAAVGH